MEGRLPDIRAGLFSFPAGYCISPCINFSIHEMGVGVSTQRVALKNASDKVAIERELPACWSPWGRITQQLSQHPFYRFKNWDRKGQCILLKIRGARATHQGCKWDSCVESRPSA